MFIYGNKSVEVRPWNIVELDGNRYYAFLPNNEHLDSLWPKSEIEDDDYKIEFTEVTMKNKVEDANKSLESDFVHYSRKTDSVRNIEDQETFVCDTDSATDTFEPINPIDSIKLGDSGNEFELVESSDISESAASRKHDFEPDEVYPTNNEEFDIQDTIEFFEPVNSTNNDFEFVNSTDYVDSEKSCKNSNLAHSSVQISTKSSINMVNMATVVTESEKTPFKQIKNVFGCQPCNIFFSTKDLLQKHMTVCEKPIIKETKKDRTLFKSIILSCSKCNFMTWNRSTLHSHIKRKHIPVQVVELICDMCGFKCRNKRQLKEHFDRKHVEEAKFECEFCGRKFKVKGDMKLHERFVHKESPIVCDICGKTCNNSSALYMHQKNKHFLPEFMCHICKRRMVSQANLDEHIERQHIRYTGVSCNICGKSFTRKSRLGDHMRIHTGDKPHECPICNKAFNRKTMLRQHLLTHSGVRPYECDICGKTFTQKPGLISHRKSHPGEHPPLPVVRIDHIINPIIQG